MRDFVVVPRQRHLRRQVPIGQPHHNPVQRDHPGDQIAADVQPGDQQRRNDADRRQGGHYPQTEADLRLGRIGRGVDRSLPGCDLSVDPVAELDGDIAGIGQCLPPIRERLQFRCPQREHVVGFGA